MARSRLLLGGGDVVVNTTLLFVCREAEAEDDANPADDEDVDVFGRIGVEKDISCCGL